MDEVGRRPTTAQKREFAQRLLALTTAKGWSQSDLARAAFGSVKDRQGRTVARRRDSVSAYLRGRVFPDPESLAALCHALAVQPKDLAPFLGAIAGGAGERVLEIRQIPDDPERVWIRLNQLVPLTDALAISAIVLKAVQDNRPSAPMKKPELGLGEIRVLDAKKEPPGFA